jgi:hypothetical protein
MAAFFEQRMGKLVDVDRAQLRVVDGQPIRLNTEMSRDTAVPQLQGRKSRVQGLPDRSEWCAAAPVTLRLGVAVAPLAWYPSGTPAISVR